MFDFLVDNSKVIAIIIALSWLVIEILKQIWKDMSEQVKLLLAVVVSVVLSYVAWVLHFIQGVSMQEFIILVLVQILGLGVVYDKVLKPIANPILNFIIEIFKR
jgi:hypothetical protein